MVGFAALTTTLRNTRGVSPQTTLRGLAAMLCGLRYDEKTAYCTSTPQSPRSDPRDGPASGLIRPRGSRRPGECRDPALNASNAGFRHSPERRWEMTIRRAQAGRIGGVACARRTPAH